MSYRYFMLSVGLFLMNKDNYKLTVYSRKLESRPVRLHTTVMRPPTPTEQKCIFRHQSSSV